MLIYYAHCTAIFDTPQEQRDVEILGQLGFKVLNPNLPEHTEGYKAKGMDYFESIVKKCDLLAFRALPDGRIPAGVLTEIGFAQDNEMPVIELPSSIKWRGISVDLTREYIKEVGAR